jgi:hypothetical protein
MWDVRDRLFHEPGSYTVKEQGLGRTGYGVGESARDIVSRLG